MLKSPIHTLGSVTPLICGILGFAFIITTFVSRDWVRQSYFPPELQPLDWKTPLFTIYRSPFVLCSANPSKTGSNQTTYDVVCTRYKVAGRGQTACQTPNETDSYSAITGDWRMCQQIHFSGNLVLAALVFICIAFALLLVLSYFFIFRAAGSSRKHAETEGQSTTATQAPCQPPAVVFGAYLLLTFLAVTAMCAFLSQCYGVLGLVQSQPDNGAWASASLGTVQDSQTGDLHHAPWIQGNALTIYLSLGWFFSIIAAGAIAGSWLSQCRA
jgi:hypothetical protein